MEIGGMTKRPATATINFVEGADSIEQALLKSGISSFCGVDEAGRGPLAGPVVAAAVVYKDCDALLRACDSKILTADRREELYEQFSTELSHGVGMATVEEIEKLNILRASLLAMQRAVDTLDQPAVTLVLVDGKHALPGPITSRAIVDGDARVLVIGAASIIAKVTRDRLMQDYDKQFPEYGFSRHKGYPTLEHREALKRIGPCPIHRRTFRGVREFLEVPAQADSPQAS